MPLRFDLKHAQQFLPPVAALECARAAFLRLKEFDHAGEPLGWSTLPKDYDKEEFDRIKLAAKKISSLCDVFIVIGIGGSYLGARAAIEFLYGQNYNHRKGATEIYFSGNSLDADAVADLLEYCRDKDVCINVISKSGTTTEPAVAFRLWRAFWKRNTARKARASASSSPRINTPVPARSRNSPIKKDMKVLSSRATSAVATRF
ncbi:MAG: hypothetical protein J6J21_00470 [Clostridia bacterium]|nr:hypothetical protein [Clostridia bacterium]